MSAQDYVIDVVVLAALMAPHLAIGWSAQRLLRRRPVPLHVLAATVVGTSSAIVAAQAVGAVGWLRVEAYIALSWAELAVVVIGLRRRRDVGAGDVREPSPMPVPGGFPTAVTWLAATATIAVLARWLAHLARSMIRGMDSHDSATYHLPFAVEYVQSGSLTRFTPIWPDPAHTFYPAATETIQALLLLGSGELVYSPLPSLAGLALLLLAGWCAGVRDGVPVATFTAAVFVAALPWVVVPSAGAALTDVPSLAMLLAGIAAWRVGDGDRGWSIVAGLALGLAVSTKLTVAPAVAGVVALIVITSAPRTRVLIAARVLLPALGVGGFWFVRNLVGTGSPLPLLDLPGLPSTPLSQADRFGGAVVDHLADPTAWRSVFGPGLWGFFGWAGVLAATAVAVSLLRRTRRRSAGATGLLVVSVVAAIGYLFTPTGAWGEGAVPDRFLFEVNLRYCLPAVILALTGAAWTTSGSARARAAFVGLVSAGSITTLGSLGEFDPPTVYVVSGAIGSLLVAIVWLTARWRRHVALGLVGLGMVVAVVGGATVTSRQADELVSHPDTAQGRVAAFAALVEPSTIAFYSFEEQLPLYGPNLDNELHYLGIDEPRKGFRAVRSCAELVAALDEIDPDYVVLGPPEFFRHDITPAVWMAALTDERPAGAAGPYSVWSVPPVRSRDCP